MLPAMTTAVEESLTRIARGENDGAHARALAEGGVATLDAASAYLEQHDLSIDAVERVEDAVKRTIETLVSAPGSLETTEALARSMKRIGFLHKLKSYAVKAASPLGYSVFFQRPGEGFSFQRHITHKIEIFHILAAPAGGYAFLCDHDSWKAAYDPDRFQRWLAGAADPTYERFRHLPEPGDLIVIDRLNVVHTVIGCVLEEFATISTDMVDRLYDQNVGRPIPPEFTRARVNALLAELPEVEPRRIFEVGPSGLVGRPQVAEKHSWGELRSVSIGPLTARHLVVHGGATTDAARSDVDSSALFVRAGTGTLMLGPDREACRRVPLEPGALTLVPAGVEFRLEAGVAGALRVSEQRLPLRTAFDLRP
jgi:mannose-6-phosphate isomerase-like protein (cupin superfamily)